jgi:SAM-dependent methyltransferase
MGSRATLEVPQALERTMIPDREEWAQSGVFAVELLCRTVGRPSLAGLDVLDVGCGTKVVKALIDNDLPIGTYTGIDAEPAVVQWLGQAVDDPRFEFEHLDAKNEMYNPGGLPLADFDRLPVGERRYDVICLFSVFTHLNPVDFLAMLKLLRLHARPDARLVFSLYLTGPDGSGIYLGPGDSPPGARFVDELPDSPLAVARYDEDYARELIDESGWRIQSVNPPVVPYIQHYVVASP